MCTAISYKTKHHYFGRNLDLEYSYVEEITITPRRFPLKFRHMGTLKKHFAMIGMAYVTEEYPLYYEGTNEKGLSMAGLNFPGNAAYKEWDQEKENITPFELIPWILGQCADVKEARNKLECMNILNENFSEHLPVSPLHWMISDREHSLTVEAMENGIRIYENPMGVLTNNPPFDQQLKKWASTNGIPGGFSSEERFARAVFVKENSVSGESEAESISQFFHILDSVAQPRGSVPKEDGKYMITRYSSCCNTELGIYYYTTYENRQINGVDMYLEDLEEKELIRYSLLSELKIIPVQNRYKKGDKRL